VDDVGSAKPEMVTFDVNGKSSDCSSIGAYLDQIGYNEDDAKLL
jgi:hypothetical protein